MRIHDVMSPPRVICQPGESLRCALLKMQFEEVDQVPVVYKDRLIGVLHRSDVVKVVGYEHPTMLEDLRLMDPLVETMCPIPAVVSAGDPVSAAAMYMDVFDLNSVPVIDDERALIGVVTQSDVVTAAIPLFELAEKAEEQALDRIAA